MRSAYEEFTFGIASNGEVVWRSLHDYTMCKLVTNLNRKSALHCVPRLPNGVLRMAIVVLLASRMHMSQSRVMIVYDLDSDSFVMTWCPEWWQERQ